MAEHTDPRILFAAERTLLAWIRTGIAIMAFGFAIARFGGGGISMAAGSLLSFLGAVLNIIGAAEYGQISKRLRAGDHEVPERPIQIAIGVAVLLGLIGLAGVGYLLFG
jgi:putative membrane protein